jgi:hypothetical protein
VSTPRIYGVAVNHNTSHFTELMLRTLFYTDDLRGIDLQLHVLDNASDDAHLGQLKAYLEERRIPSIQTGFDNALAPEKHGAAFDRFVAEHDDCTHYLFLDSDIWFVEQDTVPTMVRELLQAPPAVFANQARIYGYYAQRVIEGREGRPGVGDVDDLPAWQVSCSGTEYTTRLARRCSPACSLVANTPVFRQVVDVIGLGRAMGFGVGDARWFDTFSLMTHVMATHSRRFVVSSRRVNHFTMTGYQPEARGLKDANCLAMLEELRAGRGMALDLFRESDWKKKRDEIRGDALWGLPR